MRSRQVGFDHHFVKPVDFGALHQVLVAAAPPVRTTGPASAVGIAPG
jgi:hypothetical protein